MAEPWLFVIKYPFISNTMNRNILLFLSLTLFAFHVKSQNSEREIIDSTHYLYDLKIELQKEWPKNSTINVVFHGHSVPAGYFKTPVVNTLGAYHYLVLEKLKSKSYIYKIFKILLYSKIYLKNFLWYYKKHLILK